MSISRQTHLARYIETDKLFLASFSPLNPTISGMAKAPAVKWTREHFLIALNLYYKLPFGKLHRGNPIIIESAKKMGRTPNSLAMKLCNFASLDPVQLARGVRGLPARQGRIGRCGE